MMKTFLTISCFIPVVVLFIAQNDAAAAQPFVGVDGSGVWSIERYCANQKPSDWSKLPISTRQFLQDLELPTIHPFCVQREEDGNNQDGRDDSATTNSRISSAYEDYYLPNIPRQGPMLKPFEHLETIWDVAKSVYAVSVVPLGSMAELWLRFFSLVIAPLVIGILYIMLYNEDTNKYYNQYAKPSNNTPKKVPPPNPSYGWSGWLLAMACWFCVLSSIVLLTDSMYVLEFGAHLGGTFLTIAIPLTFRICQIYRLTWTRRQLYLLILLCCYLLFRPSGDDEVCQNKITDDPFLWLNQSIHFGEPMEQATGVQEGLYYYAAGNPFLDSAISKYWSPNEYTYSYDNGATPWMVTGDARTALPFVLNKAVVQDREWYRVWLPLTTTLIGGSPVDDGEDAGEVVAIDCTFPNTATGYDATKPVYMALHGINGGTHEEYIIDFAQRRTDEDGATVCVMVARGLEDLPVRGWRNFHGARWTDAHQASWALRNAMAKTLSSNSNDQLLVGVGYSMGAIILSNLVGRAGKECALDAAVAISGGLDMRYQTNFYRAQRLFQPIVTMALRGTFLLGKWGERVRARLTTEEMKNLMHGTHVTDIDKYCVAPYNGFRDVDHYYSEMSMLGDVSAEEYELGQIHPHRRVHQVSIPTVVVHAIDDPLITWRTVAANQGPLHPINLTRTGTGNLIIVLTEKGGHVGWPLGVISQQYKWKWMNDIPASFAGALMKAKNDQNEMHEKEDDTEMGNASQ